MMEREEGREYCRSPHVGLDGWMADYRFMSGERVTSGLDLKGFDRISIIRSRMEGKREERGKKGLGVRD